eukprot:426305_1
MAESSSSSSSELYAPQQKIANNNTQSPEGKQRPIAKSLEINIQKENAVKEVNNVQNFKEVNSKSPTTPMGHSYSAVPVYIAHSPRLPDHAAGSNVYCVACYRIIIHMLLLYCVLGVTYLLVFQQKTSPFYTNTDDNAFTQITDNPSTEPSAEPSVSPTSDPISSPTRVPSMAPTLDLMNFHVGDYKLSAQNVSHDDWLLCDGAEVLITDYPLLYDLISTGFGVPSNQSLFYKLPNATNKVIGVVSPNDAHSMGDVVGSETGTITLSESQLPSHSHVLINADDGHCDSGRDGQDPYLASHCWNGGYTGGNENSDYGLARTDAPPNALSSGSVGASNPINIMQPTIYAGNLFIYAQ